MRWKTAGTMPIGRGRLYLTDSKIYGMGIGCVIIHLLYGRGSSKGWQTSHIYMSDTFETWLTERDLERLWMIIEEKLPDQAASVDEIKEFQRLLTHCITDETARRKRMH